MARHRTSDVATALAWAGELLGPASAAAFLLAPQRFEFAEREDDSLSLTLGGARRFGVGFGPRPPVDDEWSSCLISESAFGDRLGPLVRVDEWDFYTRPTAAVGVGGAVEIVRDETAVERLLRENAPNSAVWPGHPEIVAWYGVSDDHGLASVAAVVRWESGYVVLSSVATRVDARGRGLARALVLGVVGILHGEGVEWLGLGVGHANVVAQNVYRATGFSPRAHFTLYAPPGTRSHAS